MDLLERYPQDIDVPGTLHGWTNGSVIRSRLVELMERTYRENGGMTGIPPFVGDTGEVDWLVHDAMQVEVPGPVIAQSAMQLFASRDDSQNWSRAIPMR